MKPLVAVLLALILIGSSPVHAGTKFTEAQKIERHVQEEWKRHDLRREVRSVMWCESRNDPWVKSSSGTYWGLLQLGESERAQTNWAWRIRTQIRAAKRWWLATGSDWDAWSQCAP